VFCAASTQALQLLGPCVAHCGHPLVEWRLWHCGRPLVERPLVVNPSKREALSKTSWGGMCQPFQKLSDRTRLNNERAYNW